MESSEHFGTVAELNLSSCQPNTLVDKINSVPGLKTSAAFLTFLRANLVLAHSAMPSNSPTPTLGPDSSQTLPLVSPSPLTTNLSSTAADGIPPLSLEVLTDRADKAAALRLIADSIAQQRQEAAFNLICHPLPLTALLTILAVIYRYTWAYDARHDLGAALLLASSACITYLAAVRFFTSGYLRAAEEVSWDFLSAGRAGTQEDLVLGTRYGSDIVATLVLRLERPSSPGGHGNGGGRRRAHSRQNSLRGGNGVIRAWTTRLKYRGKGLGGDLLREAVRLTRERCGRDTEVGFAREHANSVMVLPEMFNRRFRKAEMQAARALGRVLKEWDGRKR